METNPDNNFPISKDGKITLNTKNGGFFIIEVEKIAYCEANGSYTILKLEDGSNIVVSKSLAVLERCLKKYNFSRCHKTYLVNCKKVEKLDRKKRILTVLGHEIPVSRRKCCQTRVELKKLNDRL